ncbi:hypothetical protein JQC92_13375 [Shewanella sp. 202IG2-18]|uniref:hypothetical protein n=1 Tax=Parashewanella hymeniacidonis TaxID=2807618 RepID=UPI001960CE32|nr:hypothetical protein [Parashewanella hymeniacidonis]MBM7073007.1 hypothetical protein [Parashewanella hymeniacidonis]
MLSSASPQRNSFTTAAALTAVLVTGTGMTDNRGYQSSVNESWIIQQTEEAKEVSSQYMTNSVLKAFGLAVKDFEPILGVKRAAIYNWKKGANEPNDYQFHLLKNLYEVSLLLDSDNIKIGKLAKTSNYKGTSLIEKLSVPSLDIDLIVAHHKLLVSKVTKQYESFESVTSKTTLLEGDSVVTIEG